MDTDYMVIEKEIESLRTSVQMIEERNQRVEKDKLWEESLTRKISIIVVTYCLMVIVLWFMGVEKPLLSSIIPTLGYFLSTLSLPVIKKYWWSAELSSACRHTKKV